MTAARTGSTGDGVLAGVRVLDFTHIVGGPFCTLQLADLGADVVKVEPPGGERLRTVVPSSVRGETKGFHALNRGKRGIVIDLRRAEGRALVHRLMPTFDVVAVSFRPGVAQRLAIDYETLREYRPDLVYVENTAWGTRGPRAADAGGDVTVQAHSGYMMVGGRSDACGAPQAIPKVPLDYMTGLAMAMGVCAALFRRAVTGEGCYIEGSMLATALAVQGGILARSARLDGARPTALLEELRGLRRQGAPHAEVVAARDRGTISPIIIYFQGYEVKDGALVLGANTEAIRERMWAVLGIDDDPTADPNFAQLDPAEQRRRYDEMEARVRAILRTRTMADWEAAFGAAGAPVARVNLPEEVAEDAQVQALDMFRDMEHPLTGPERLVGPLLRFGGQAREQCPPSPALGAQTTDVLREAGFADSEIARLERDGVVGARPRP